MFANLSIIFAILTVAGAFMWLKPSAHDRRLSQLRSAALSQGMKLYSLKVPDTSVEGRVGEKHELRTLYRLLHAFPKAQAPSFTVLRTTGVSSAFLPDGWIWADDKRASDAQMSALVGFLNDLPQRYSVVDAQADGVGVSWDESGIEQLPAVRETLQRLASILS
ncbi:hypothetical protein ABMA57_08050 [Saccharospirillum sp. HFRX-1]|uniref:hypothetical protein n=1 Tax=unclassified Saccharospirillum TaxID=2633430 RepID=UPI00371B7DD2